MKKQAASVSVRVPEAVEILTPVEVATLLRTSKSWVYEKCRRRCKDPLPCYRIGGYLRFEKAVVLEWARAHCNAVARKLQRAA